MKKSDNAGYRKIMNGKELNSEPDEEECDVVDDYIIGFATYLMQKRRDEVDRMQAEIKRLKKENEQLKAKLKARLTCDFVRTAQKHAVQDFADKLKTQFEAKEQYYICMYDWSGHSAVVDCVNEVDELLKEYE